jgi:hypothetical protein
MKYNRSQIRNNIITKNNKQSQQNLISAVRKAAVLKISITVAITTISATTIIPITITMIATTLPTSKTL